MDGHPSGLPQGAGGQNPAYRSAHRHPPRWGQGKGWAFVSAFRVVGGCTPNCVGTGRRPVKRILGALGDGIRLRVVVALGKTGYVPSAVPKPGESLADLAPSTAAKWDQAANGDLTPDMVTVKSHKRVDWVCEVADDHRWCPHGSPPPSPQRKGNSGVCPLRLELAD